MTEYKHRYDYLNAKNYRIYDDNKGFIRDELLEEIDQFSLTDYYDKERMIAISESNSVQDELNKLIKNLLEYRQENPDGSNHECMCMNQITEFIGNLDMLDFRKLNIQALLTVPPEKTPEEKTADKKKREEVKLLIKDHPLFSNL